MQIFFCSLFQRCTAIGLFIFATFLLILSVAALIVTFAAERFWFTDTFNQTTTNSNYRNQYGLWRLCVFANQTCDSWFSTDGPISYYIDQRLNQARGKHCW